MRLAGKAKGRHRAYQGLYISEGLLAVHGIVEGA